jgi:hypothetical protein
MLVERNQSPKLIEIYSLINFIPYTILFNLIIIKLIENYLKKLYYSKLSKKANN